MKKDQSNERPPHILDNYFDAKAKAKELRLAARLNRRVAPAPTQKRAVVDDSTKFTTSNADFITDGVEIGFRKPPNPID